jgi:leucine dehydrogenase
VFQPRHHRIEDPDSGLLAFVVIDDTTLGPAAGGIRTRRYASEDAARADAAALARAMTYKCALAGLPAGGGKGVVMLREGLDRERGFERLGAFVDSLGGGFLTAGDLGTTAADLEAMSRRTAHVYTDEAGLAAAVGRGCVRAMQAGVAFAEVGERTLEGLRVAIQGCGTVGAAVAREAARHGARIVLADLDATIAGTLAAELDAEVVAPGSILETEADLLSPCAGGGAIDSKAARRLRVAAVCGAANNILASAAAERILMRRGVVWVPDPLSSAGAVILGVGRRVVGLSDCDRLIDRIFATTRQVLTEARASARPASAVARELAERRIRDARATS